MPYDGIIIGSRVAGAATAMLLARRGYKILVVDRATFPSDTISTHIIWQHGVARLFDWGLGDRLAALNAQPLHTLELNFGPIVLTGTPPPVGGACTAFAPRRTKLDKMLVDAAADAGAEVREGFAVNDIIFEEDRVAGIRGRGKGGETVRDRAKVVIGADGVHSPLAQTVQAAEYDVKPSLTCWYYSYWSGVLNSRLRFFSRPNNAIGCIPTNDSLVCIAVAWPHDRFSEVKCDIEGNYFAALELVPDFKKEVLDGKREERFYGMSFIPNYFRKPYGRGWALVGDAGYNKDPIMAQGISDAFRDAALLTDAIDAVFSGGADWDEALGQYESSRNQAVQGIYEMNAEFASLKPPPAETSMLIAALQGNQEAIDKFLGTMTGAVRVEDFYAPENVAQILAAARKDTRTAAAH
jgi:2-polyprenyl-6-methoxyphenol hydroxylase-like FAD-dependent oxidoreductase